MAQYFKQNDNVVRVSDEEAGNYTPENGYEPATKAEWIAQIVAAGAQVNWAEYDDITPEDVNVVANPVAEEAPAEAPVEETPAEPEQ
jgi:hypothetical protein